MDDANIIITLSLMHLQSCKSCQAPCAGSSAAWVKSLSCTCSLNVTFVLMRPQKCCLFYCFCLCVLVCFNKIYTWSHGLHFELVILSSVNRLNLWMLYLKCASSVVSPRHWSSILWVWLWWVLHYSVVLLCMCACGCRELWGIKKPCIVRGNEGLCRLSRSLRHTETHTQGHTLGHTHTQE